MTLEEIDARIRALGRPKLTRFADALRQGAVDEVRILQATWDATHPEEAAERRHLLVAAAKLQGEVEAERYAEAVRARDLETMRGLVGDRIAKNLHAPREEAPLLVARQWLTSDAWALTLCGSKGNGKTFAAAWAALRSAWRPVVWLHSPTACARPLYGPQAQSDMDRAQRAPLFVLDEFGAELASAPWMTMLEAVLGVRYARGLKTIVTSNLGMDKFKERMGERLADRLKEGMQFVSSGPSLRQRGGWVAKHPDALEPGSDVVPF